jgi:hypothetical protein
LKLCVNFIGALSDFYFNKTREVIYTVFQEAQEQIDFLHEAAIRKYHELTSERIDSYQEAYIAHRRLKTPAFEWDPNHIVYGKRSLFHFIIMDIKGKLG